MTVKISLRRLRVTGRDSQASKLLTDKIIEMDQLMEWSIKVKGLIEVSILPYKEMSKEMQKEAKQLPNTAFFCKTEPQAAPSSSLHTTTFATARAPPPPSEASLSHSPLAAPSCSSTSTPSSLPCSPTSSVSSLDDLPEGPEKQLPPPTPSASSLISGSSNSSSSLRVSSVKGF